MRSTVVASLVCQKISLWSTHNGEMVDINLITGPSSGAGQSMGLYIWYTAENLITGPSSGAGHSMGLYSRYTAENLITGPSSGAGHSMGLYSWYTAENLSGIDLMLWQLSDVKMSFFFFCLFVFHICCLVDVSVGVNCLAHPHDFHSIVMKREYAVNWVAMKTKPIKSNHRSFKTTFFLYKQPVYKQLMLRPQKS